MSTSGMVRAACIAAAVGLVACGEDSAPLTPFGEQCVGYVSAPQCETDMACMGYPGSSRGICTYTCTVSEECPTEYACTQLPDGFSICAPQCSSDYSLEYGGVHYACIGAVRTPCTVLPYGAHCSACGCTAGDYCVSSEELGCHPKLAVGEACTSDEACQSGNCDSRYGSTDRFCMVPVGDPCTSDNCSRCLGGGVFCSRNCGTASTTSYRCPDEYHCAGHEDEYHCVTECSPSGTCAGTMECRFVTATYPDPSFSACF